MPNISSGVNTVIFVLHEIYGINDHIKQVCEEFSNHGYDVVCPELAETNEVFDYLQEEEAYRHFMDDTGFELAARKVEKLIIKARSKYKYVFIAGYSIGATVAWLCSHKMNMCDGIIGYYGSRIRDYVDLTPQCPVLLFFPEEEKSFSMKKLTVSLKKENVEIQVFKGNHGFCDPFGPHYYQQSCKEAEKIAYGFFNRCTSFDMEI